MTESTLNYSKIERDWKGGGDRKRDAGQTKSTSMCTTIAPWP